MSDHRLSAPLSQTEKLVSFVITYYNEPLPLLQTCIDSILSLRLSAEEREIILIDDGSSVVPQHIIDTYAANLIYVRQPNGGLSEARNRGIEIAAGRYLQFIDGDDYLIRRDYEYCLSIVGAQSPDLVLFHGTDKEADTNELTTYGVFTGSQYMHNHNLRATAWGYIFRRSLLGTLRFTKGMLHEDEEFTPQLIIRAEQVVDTNARAYFYRQRSNSITHKADAQWVTKRLADKERIILSLREKADRMPTSERVAMQRRVAQLTMDYIHNVITLTRDAQCLDATLERLKKLGLFPLPNKHYTGKYRIFRALTSSSIGRKILLKTLPRMK